MKLCLINRESTIDRNVAKLYPHVKLVFTPSVEFKKEMQDISYEVLRNNTQETG